MLTLEIKRKIEEKADLLVEKAKDIVDYEWEEVRDKESSKTEKTFIYKEVDKAQIRHILDISMQTDSIKALILFIEYQMGRNKIPRKWGDELIRKIEDLAKLAKEISASDAKEINLEIVRLFLGYLNRYFIYKEGGV